MSQQKNMEPLPKGKRVLSGLFKKTETSTNLEEPQSVSLEVSKHKNIKGADQSDPVNPQLASIEQLFSLNMDARSDWGIEKYKNIILKVDRSLTEAFFLKGKLLEEVKEKFFKDSEREQNWKDFCTSELNLNYTTANQYIRVAQEFDVTSHQRTDFSFEHFKILLPLPQNERQHIIQSSPTLNVKSFRLLVQEHIKVHLSQIPKNLGRKGANGKKSHLKEFLRLLEATKSSIQEWDREDLTQSERWQVSGACLNLCEQLKKLSEDILGDEAFIKGNNWETTSRPAPSP